MDTLFGVLAALATILLAGSLGYALYLRVLTRNSRSGRIIFGIIVSLKAFVLLVLLDFFTALAFPGWVSNNRQIIRFGLVVYLLVQTSLTLLALHRLHRYGD